MFRFSGRLTEFLHSLGPELPFPASVRHVRCKTDTAQCQSLGF